MTSVVVSLPARAGDVPPALPLANEVGVRVEKPAGDGVHYAQGSGVFLGDGLVLTAAHVIERDPAHKEVTVLVDGIRTPGKVVLDGHDHGADLALIKIEPSVLLPKRRVQKRVPICSSNPGPSQGVVVASLGTVTTATTIPTPISSDGHSGEWTNLLSTGYHQGNSGGGVFNPNKGCLWGIIFLELGGHLNGNGPMVDLTAFEPVTKISPFLADYDAEASHSAGRHPASAPP